MSYDFIRAREDMQETGMAFIDQLTESERDKLVQWSLKHLVCPLMKRKVTAVKRSARFSDVDNRWHDVLLISDVVSRYPDEEL